MWLKEKSVSALSEFLSDAKFSTYEMNHIYALRTLHLYKIKSGYFIIDDTLKHHPLLWNGLIPQDIAILEQIEPEKIKAMKFKLAA